MVKARLSVNSEGNFNLFKLERNMGIKQTRPAVEANES